MEALEHILKILRDTFGYEKQAMLQRETLIQQGREAHRQRETMISLLAKLVPAPNKDVVRFAVAVDKPVKQ
jgi:hypothetical protein